MIIDVILEQAKKASSPIDVKPEGIVIEVRL